MSTRDFLCDCLRARPALSVRVAVGPFVLDLLPARVELSCGACGATWTQRPPSTVLRIVEGYDARAGEREARLLLGPEPPDPTGPAPDERIAMALERIAARMEGA